MIKLENVFDDFCVVNLLLIWTSYYSVYESFMEKCWFWSIWIICLETMLIRSVIKIAAHAKYNKTSLTFSCEFKWFEFPSAWNWTSFVVKNAREEMTNVRWLYIMASNLWTCHISFSSVDEKQNWSFKKQSQKNMAFRAVNLAGLSLLLIFAPCRSLTKQVSQTFDIAEEDSTVDKRSLTNGVGLLTTKSFNWKKAYVLII